ncbi:hypothetical protein [Novispirillum itersonii]|uniref:hypothetical protein n=1 Tax=Novispirillum itersonii TaxID=189 RepID=UPI0003673C6A|nr:hypothetical protein [Novispirillum itersonii]
MDIDGNENHDDEEDYSHITTGEALLSANLPHDLEEEIFGCLPLKEQKAFLKLWDKKYPFS